MIKVTRELILNIFEQLIVLILGGISIAISWEVLKNYKSLDSTFKISETPIFDVPTIVICFSPSTENYVYGVDFNISKFWNGNKDDSILVEGHNPAKSITLTKLLTSFNGICYKLTTTSIFERSFNVELISVTFNGSLSARILPNVLFFFTDEKNAFGITATNWNDGEMWRFEMNKYKSFVEIALKTETYSFLTDGKHGLFIKERNAAKMFFDVCLMIAKLCKKLIRLREHS